MRTSRQFVLAALGLSLGSALWAAGPTTSDLPYPAAPQSSSSGFSSGGAMASGSASGFASGNGNGFGQATSRAQVQIGGFPQVTTGSPGDALNGNMPGNLINLNPNGLINPAVFNGTGFNPAGINSVAGNPVAGNPTAMNTRATATITSGEDKIITGADEQYSTVIKMKPNGQITMIVVTLANMEVRRTQGQNVDELRKKDKQAFTEYLKYTEAQ